MWRDFIFGKRLTLSVDEMDVFKINDNDDNDDDDDDSDDDDDDNDAFC